MPVYAKQVATNHPRFQGRATELYTWGSKEEPADPGYPQVATIPIPNSVVLCNGCNENIAEEEVAEGDTPKGYLVYLGKRELKADQPYDIYCSSCLKRHFPKAIIGEL